MITKNIKTVIFITLVYLQAFGQVQNEPITKWFSDAKLGMFIHFGLYSEPAGEWNGQRTGRGDYAEWLHMQGNWPYGIEKKEYQKLAKTFNPKNFNADAWIKSAKEAGMKYFLITAKHHDGFALWPSKVCKYNVVDATPFKRDILGELAKACEKYGLALGFYYSHWQDWEHKGGAMPPHITVKSETLHPIVSDADFESYWQEKCLPQVKELMLNYKPKFFWFDTWMRSPHITEHRVDELIKTVKEIDETCLVNSRIGAHIPGIKDKVDYISMGDNQVPNKGEKKVWETSFTSQNSWGYHKLDFKWKDSGEIIKVLVQNAAHGGNLQLNIGPKGDGTFPKPNVKRLKELSAWVAVNGEAIYGAEPSPVEDPDWGYITSKTLKNGNTKLFLHVLNSKPGMEIDLKLPYAPSTSISPKMLETGESLYWYPQHKKMNIVMPHFVVDKNVSVIEIVLNHNIHERAERLKKIEAVKFKAK
ncbi:alpha-L-fucosidase [Tamlana sp. 2201CG12-4]|uniref:alpha-L-fucosidase n=1 Tax=Tamlana sp. 2201CG12-4 TaxID=3112582 RepID=UPI002DBCB4D3|nr:alpha-L-fucosidase [Tamlana sp. 2201CG12-4]MEC3908660.1 alpha-L-fucosidase [Tamlana sp. 2201CG12-4]